MKMPFLYLRIIETKHTLASSHSSWLSKLLARSGTSCLPYRFYARIVDVFALSVWLAMCLFFCQHFVIVKTASAVLCICYHIIVTLETFWQYSWHNTILYLKDSIIYVTNDFLLTIKSYIVGQSYFNLSPFANIVQEINCSAFPILLNLNSVNGNDDFSTSEHGHLLGRNSLLLRFEVFIPLILVQSLEFKE